MEKTFRYNWISAADILSCGDSLESNLNWKNMWKHLKSGKIHTIVCSWNKSVTNIVFHHCCLAYLDSEAFGGRQLERRGRLRLLWVWGLWWPRVWRCWGWPRWRGWCSGGPGLSLGMGGWGGRASNKYTFRKASQLRFRKSCFPKDSQVQNACTSASFRKYALQKNLGFASHVSQMHRHCHRCTVSYHRKHRVSILACSSL